MADTEQKEIVQDKKPKSEKGTPEKNPKDILFNDIPQGSNLDSLGFNNKEKKVKIEKEPTEEYIIPCNTSHHGNLIAKSLNKYSFDDMGSIDSEFNHKKAYSWLDRPVQEMLDDNYETRGLDENLANKVVDSDKAQKELRSNYCTNTVSIMGVAVKEGQQLSGVELSPGLFRKCGLTKTIEMLGWKVRDVGDITTEDCQERMKAINNNDKVYKYDLENCDVLGAMNERLADYTNKSSIRKDFTLILGGDHGQATGSIGGMLRTYPDLKVVWIDAHGDCNIPETSPSQNYHGMPVAHLQGWIEEGAMRGFDWFKPSQKPENIVYIGLRDVDEGEKVLLKKHKIKCYSPYDIEFRGGIHTVMKEVEEYLDIGPDSKNAVHCSWDVDGCDPIFMEGTGTKARAGLTLRESHFILQRLFQSKNLVSLDMVEVNTLLDGNTDREHLHGDNPYLRGKQTIIYACELILSGMGFSWL